MLLHWLSAPVSRRLLKVLLTEGSDAAEAQRDTIARDAEPLRKRWQQQLDDDARRKHWLTALAFVVWVVSGVGFGVHAFRVRRAALAVEPVPADGSPPGESSPGPDASILGGSAGP